MNQYKHSKINQPPTKPTKHHLFQHMIVAVCTFMIMCVCLFSLYGMGISHLPPPTTNHYLNQYGKRMDKGDFIKLTSINLNTATKDELMLIPSIGEVLASRVVAHREVIGCFTTYDQLLDIKGIGEKTLVKIKVFGYIE